MNIISRYKFLFASTLIVGAGLVFVIKLNAQPSQKPKKEEFVLQLVSYMLSQWHYSPKAIDDSLSGAAFDEYIKTLDYGKRYFTKPEIKDLEKYRYDIDNQILNSKLIFFNQSTELLVERMKYVESQLDTILADPMDFKTNESFLIEEKDYADDKQGLIDRWRKYLKYNVLTRVYVESESEKTKASKDSTYTAKPFEEIEKKARESVLKNYKDYFKRLGELNKEDWFSMYVNAITSYFDPHTSYMAPREEKDFNASMSGQLEGIGAILQAKDGFVSVSSIVPGSPSAKQGDLQVGDQILEVAQGPSEYVNIVGMRLDDAVDLIRGKKGTTVRLKVQKADSSVKEVSIVRDVVEIEDTFVRSSIVEKDGRKFAVIYVPKFYVNFENKDSRESASDLEKEIQRLKQEGVEGIALDLRNNTGGALVGAVKMGGLFIEQGPIVQTKTKGERAKVLPDTDPSVAWNGPLVILINNVSASASEILAGAMKDYKRAVIIGTQQTFGKGTVQNVIELDDMVRNKLFGDESLGAVKLTVEKFYRINGSSTQVKGVPSDVVMPDVFSVLDYGEAKENYAMEWDSIPMAAYTALNEDFSPVIKRSQGRVSTNPYFAKVQENIKWLSERKENKIVSLLWDEFAKEDKKYREEAKRFDSLNKYEGKYKISSPVYELELIKSDTILAAKRETWHKGLSKDATLEEAINILDDIRVSKKK